MARILLACMVMVFTVGCSGQVASQEEFDALKRRVTILEKKAQAMDMGAKPKGKAGLKDGNPGAKAAKSGAKVGIKITGDALKVMLLQGKKRVPVPATVPAGDYVIHALFTKDGKPVEAGKVSLKGKKDSLTFNCLAETQKCVVEKQD